jgi:PAS domain S-box-containing protein
MEPLIHILHLEDDDADAKLVQAILEEAALTCQITRVQTGEELWEALHQGGYDVILADYRLPNYNGMAALRLVQELGLDIPFIFVSGVMGEDAAIEGLREGATDYVLKQKLSRLVPAVKRAIHEAENRRQRQQAERSLAEQFQFLQLLIDSIPSSIFYKDVNGFYLGCNQNLAEFLGRPKEEIIGKTVFGTYPQEQAEKYYQMDQKLLQNPGTQIYEFMMERADGAMRNFIFSQATFVDFSGKVAGLIGVMTDITERKRAEETIKVSLKEKEVLLREIYHRTKNNLQVVCSLLKLQSVRFSDPQLLGAFEDTGNRIRSMALVHEKLYQSKDLSHIDLKDYIKDLANFLLSNYQTEYGKISLHLDLHSVIVSIDAAMPCGLMINELVSNAIKHAFPGERKGMISIFLNSTQDGDIELRVADDGVGLPPELDVWNTDSLGLKLAINLATSQLQGKLAIRREHGTEFRLLFRELDYKPRI